MIVTHVSTTEIVQRNIIVCQADAHNLNGVMVGGWMKHWPLWSAGRYQDCGAKFGCLLSRGSGGN